MEAKAGDRIAVDGKKVGQAKRLGVIIRVTKGLSGLRYSVEWDDGTSSIIAPSFGNLTIKPGKAKKKAKPAAKKKAKAKSAKR